MNTVLLLLLLTLLVWLWQNGLRAREKAVNQCRKICNEMQFQLLDETVALVTIKLRRTGNGTIKALRRYRFEFSIDGYGRSRGHIVLHDDKIENIHMEHPDGTIILPQKNGEAIH